MRWTNPDGGVLSGVDHIVRRGDADPRRLFVGGGTYGGYLTAWTVTHTERFRAAYVPGGLLRDDTFDDPEVARSVITAYAPGS